MGRPSRINIVRLAATWIFFAEYHQKMQKKVIFYIRAIYSSFWYWYPNPGYHHENPHVLRIPKMSYFLGVGVSKGELLLLKVNRLWNFGSVSKIKRCNKKKTRPQFWVFGSETNSRCSPPYELPWLFVSGPKNQNCGSSFFLTPPPTHFFFWNLTWLWQPITPL